MSISNCLFWNFEVCFLRCVPRRKVGDGSFIDEEGVLEALVS
jgi:hypothetical protein